MKTILKNAIAILVLGQCNMAASFSQPLAPAELDRYNVVWTTPSKDASGSMPIGNGEVGLNVWVEEDGDLLFYIARTDSWSESNQLLKLGRIRVHLSPNPFAKGRPFRQELRLRTGEIVITADDATLRVFVDADAPVVYVTGDSATPRSVSAALEIWRTEKHVFTSRELDARWASCWSMHDAPDSIQVWESADALVDAGPDTVAWRHRNEHSIVPFTLKHQGLESCAHLVKDPLLNRTFGGQIVGDGFQKDGANALKSTRPMAQFALAIVAHSSQAPSPADWDREVSEMARKARSADAAAAAAKRTAAWWNDFWNRSWIFVSGDQAATDNIESAKQDASTGQSGSKHPFSRVSEAYILQRWITACGGRGNYPIKFNGSIFTVDPKFSGEPDFNVDWRRWGDCYWWQNTRFPYFPMIARGDFDEARILCKFYLDILPLCKARAKLYYGADGAYFPETLTIYGAYSNGDYGWNEQSRDAANPVMRVTREGRQPGWIVNPYLRCIWQDGLELLSLMLDYYEHTDDPKFLKDELIPMAHEVLRYYDTRFPRNEQGKISINPTQSIETYWYDVVNDTPNVAGLNAVLDRLLVMSASDVPPVEREFWKKMKAAAPAVPMQTEDGKTYILPAEKFKPERTNGENPELYPVWPFRMFGVGRPNLEIGIETFHRRLAKESTDWFYDGQCAAILGLADETKPILLGKLGWVDRNYRFPVMWGPTFDWLPDQCHGGNVMLTLQHMLLETTGDKIFVLPAWPKEWDVSFKLYAPHRTVVECEYRLGKIERLEVTPASRRNDVQYPIWLHERNP